ncbi:response regulator transcription factor [Sphingomonas sp. Root241]|uniref:response regulator transcription factor n=1 Tax=Sphingomonas sp. Root241 TaxID=1736501 RepID=UPI0006F92E26|nr:response regulator transcription factor [Sphingomonas sp. Root241]KRC81575.1 two-component system response regulator [Sphingomonas sp. Root241]
MSRVLVVDDESAIRRLLRAVLERGGHDVVEAGDARTALGEQARGGCTAAIVDLGLPDRDGLELVAALRGRAPELPIVVLSARTATADKIAALDLGADDYVTKPFDGDELLARLRSVLRRGRAPADPVIRHGPLAIDRARHCATLAEAQVPLTPREFALMAALAEAGGRILTHRQLLERVWGPAHATDVEYLRVAIRALRRKFERDPNRPVLILNEPGIGYRLSESPPAASD